MKQIKKVILTILASLPIGSISYAEFLKEKWNLTPNLDTDLTSSGISKGEIFLMKKLFNKDSSKHNFKSIYENFKLINPELSNQSLNAQFLEAIAKLKSRGLIDQSGVDLSSAPSAWRAE
jgi:hypothetical protein